MSSRAGGLSSSSQGLVVEALEDVEEHVASLASRLDSLVEHFLDLELAARVLASSRPRGCNATARTILANTSGEQSTGTYAAVPRRFDVPRSAEDFHSTVWPWCRKRLVDRPAIRGGSFDRVPRKRAVLREHKLLFQIGPAAVVAKAEVNSDCAVIGHPSGLRTAGFVLEEDRVTSDRVSLSGDRCEQNNDGNQETHDLSL